VNGVMKQLTTRGHYIVGTPFTDPRLGQVAMTSKSWHSRSGKSLMWRLRWKSQQSCLDTYKVVPPNDS